MDPLFATPVFFVRDAGLARDFYTQTFGFTLDWTHEEHGGPFVFRVSFLGFELILNQVEAVTDVRAGHGRIFIGLGETQAEAVLRHVETRGIRTSVTHWGAPTLVLRDLDANETFCWFPDTYHARLAGRLAGSDPG